MTSNMATTLTIESEAAAFYRLASRPVKRLVKFCEHLRSQDHLSDEEWLSACGDVSPSITPIWADISSLLRMLANDPVIHFPNEDFGDVYEMFTPINDMVVSSTIKLFGLREI